MAKRRRRRGLGESSEQHRSDGDRSYNEIKRLIKNIPPTCEGGLRVTMRLATTIAHAKAHYWAMPTPERAKVSAKMGDLNRWERTLGDKFHRMIDKCARNRGRWDD